MQAILVTLRVSSQYRPDAERTEDYKRLETTFMLILISFKCLWGKYCQTTFNTLMLGHWGTKSWTTVTFPWETHKNPSSVQCLANWITSLFCSRPPTTISWNRLYPPWELSTAGPTNQMSCYKTVLYRLKETCSTIRQTSTLKKSENEAIYVLNLFKFCFSSSKSINKSNVKVPDW